MFKPFAAAVAVLALGATAVMAQDVIKDRQAAMKATGGGMGALVKMVKGETPFDAAAAQAVFKAHADVAAKVPSMFPDSSKTGDTKALPAVWEKKADFDAAAKKWGAEATAAAASVKDLDSLKMAMANYPKNCGGCHETFRAK